MGWEKGGGGENRRGGVLEVVGMKRRGSDKRAEAIRRKARKGGAGRRGGVLRRGGCMGAWRCEGWGGVDSNKVKEDARGVSLFLRGEARDARTGVKHQILQRRDTK